MSPRTPPSPPPPPCRWHPGRQPAPLHPKPPSCSLLPSLFAVAAEEELPEWLLYSPSSFEGAPGRPSSVSLATAGSFADVVWWGSCSGPQGEGSGSRASANAAASSPFICREGKAPMVDAIVEPCRGRASGGFMVDACRSAVPGHGGVPPAEDVGCPFMAFQAAVGAPGPSRPLLQMAGRSLPGGRSGVGCRVGHPLPCLNVRSPRTLLASASTVSALVTSP
jgi:hypothetical protein